MTAQARRPERRRKETRGRNGHAARASGQPPGRAARRRGRLDRRLENLALALLSGILLAAPFLLPALWWLHYAALIPWVVLLTREHERAAWLYFFAGAYVFFIMSLGPFSIFHKTVPFVLAAFYAPFLLPFALLLRRIYLRSRLPFTLLVPIIWVTTEWLRLQFSIGQVAIFPLGTSQFSLLKLIQIADISGVAGISFTVATANGAVADVLLGRSFRGWQAVWPAGVFPLLLIAVLLYGTSKVGRHRDVAGPRVALVQPNVTHYKDPSKAKSTFEEQLRFTREEIAPGSADLVVLPENAVSAPIGDDPSYLEELGGLAREQAARLLIGAVSWASREPPRVYTSAYYLSEDGVIIRRYDKLHLIPWAEYMPFERWLPRLSPALGRTHYALTNRLLGYVSFGVPGKELVLFPFESTEGVLRFAVPICFEVASGEFAREAVGKGADFLLNITSEGVFGPPIYMHMLAHSTIRAVENRVAVVRVGNNGISGIIDASGRVRSLVRGGKTGRLFLEEGAMVDRVPVNPRGGGSFYTRHGDVFAYLCVATSLILFAFSFSSSRRASESNAPGM